MATWKKVVVSGSSAELAGLTVDAQISGDISGNAGGNAATATQLQTARDIGGVSFDGTANINLPGVNSAGSQDTSGNAATATQLETARNINGVSFDGTANITVTAAGSTLSDTVTIAKGGTGATSRQAAIDALTNSATATQGHVLSVDANGNAIFSAANAGDITGIDAGTGIVVTDPDTATPTVSVTTAISSGAAAGATANQDSTATILGGNLTGQVNGVAVATVTAGAAAGATANQDSTATILGGNLTGQVNGVAVATVTAGAAAGATANQDSTATILADSSLTGTTSAAALNVSGDTVLAGNLTVQGTASFESTENLLVKDRFIGLASGSAGAADGGIVVEQSNVGGGKGAVFAYDGLSEGRWGIDLDFNPTASAYTPAAFMSAVLKPAAANSAAAILAIDANYNKAGNIYTSTATGNDIWIYS